jgi:glycosyltransferase involved in cell wall biosynthesis
MTMSNRICMYTPTADGGHARYSFELMTALTSGFGPRFELVTSQDVEEQYRLTTYPVHAILPRTVHRKELGSKLAWAANRLLHYPHCEKAFLGWLGKRPDIAGVHFQEHTAWRATGFFRRVRDLDKSVFYTVHNIRPHSYPPFISPAIVDGWNRDAYRSCDALFVLTAQLRDELKEFLEGTHPPIEVTPHGVWSVRDTEQTRSLQDRLDQKRLLFFGTIRKNKGLDVLLTAMKLLPGYSLTIAGEPREKEYFETAIIPAIDRARAAGTHIDLIPRFTPDDEVGKLFAASSALILPYTSEFTAQSGVAFMSLAYELPMVASSAGGLKDLFHQYEIGTQFQTLEPGELANAINRLLTVGATKLISQIKAAKADMSWSKAAAATAGIYDRYETPIRRAA